MTNKDLCILRSRMNNLDLAAQIIVNEIEQIREHISSIAVDDGADPQLPLFKRSETAMSPEGHEQ